MIESEEFKDELVKGFVQSGVKTLMSKDFENIMMLKINTEIEFKKEVSTNLKKSLLFFIGALLLGIMVSLISLFSILFDEILVKSITIFVLFLLSTVGILSVNTYLTLGKKYSW